MADHMAVVAKVKGVKLPEPEFPTALSYLWNHFVALDGARGGNGFGPNPIGYTVILAYAHLMRVRFQPWEVDAIRRLDEEYLRAMAK